MGRPAPTLREQVEQLSPITHAARITCPVDVVVPPRDKYVPVDDHLAFVRACPSARLVVSSALAHAIRRLSREGAVGLLRLERSVARFLGSATA